MLEISQLRYFITVARAGSFRRAARSLRVEQSSISRGVRRLEDRLGVSLFERSHTGARLTDAGKRFLADACPALEQLELAERMAAAAGRAETGIVRVGIITALISAFLRDLISSFTEQRPDVRIDVRNGSRADHLAAIRGRQLDIAFVTGVPDIAECETAELWREPAYVALPKDHRLARRRKLDWPDLRDERFIVCRLPPGPEAYTFIVRRAADYSTFPDIAYRDVTQETLMSLVGLGHGITLVSGAWADVKLPDLVLRPLMDAEDIVPFSAVWSPQNDNPALRRFISAAHVLAGRVRRGASDWSIETINCDAPSGFGSSVDGRKPDPSP